MTPLIPSGRHWITTQDQPFTLADGTVLVVPKGFVFDGHSLGVVLSGFLNAYSYDMYAALLHDFCTVTISALVRAQIMSIYDTWRCMELTLYAATRLYSCTPC